MTVTVSPSTFTMVQFEASDIQRIAERLQSQVGLPAELAIEIEVDETSPLGRAVATSLDPLHVKVEGGALENPKRLRALSEDNAVDVLGLVFLQARDRLDPEFAAPGLGQELSLAHRVAWDAFAMGRVERLGYRAQRVRRLYHFRNRHGFTDAADAAFDRLWAGEITSWADLVAVSDSAHDAVGAS